MTHEPQDILIVGGGIGGLTLALCLHAAGRPCRVFEAAPTIKPLGVGINLLPHAVGVLSSFGLAPELARVAIEAQEYVFMNRHGQEILADARGSTAGYAFPQYSIHRGDLQMILLAAAQQALGRGRRFDRIDLKSRDGVAIANCQTAIKRALGEGFEVEPPSSRGQQFDALMKGYTTGTAISSLFALVVGMFIIYNSFAIAVTQRVTEIGILRALGATRTSIIAETLAEAAIIALAGGAVGLTLAHLVIRAASVPLGLPLTIRLPVALGSLMAAALAGIVAGWYPARRAVSSDVIAALRQD